MGTRRPSVEVEVGDVEAMQGRELFREVARDAAQLLAVLESVQLGRTLDLRHEQRPAVVVEPEVGRHLHVLVLQQLQHDRLAVAVERREERRALDHVTGRPSRLEHDGLEAGCVDVDEPVGPPPCLAPSPDDAAAHRPGDPLEEFRRQGFVRGLHAAGAYAPVVSPAATTVLGMAR